MTPAVEAPIPHNTFRLRSSSVPCYKGYIHAASETSYSRAAVYTCRLGLRLSTRARNNARVDNAGVETWHWQCHFLSVQTTAWQHWTEYKITWFVAVSGLQSPMSGQSVNNFKRPYNPSTRHSIDFMFGSRLGSLARTDSLVYRGAKVVEWDRNWEGFPFPADCELWGAS